MLPRERAMQWYDDNLSVLADQPKEVRAVVILSVQNAITAAVEAEREAIINLGREYHRLDPTWLRRGAIPVEVARLLDAIRARSAEKSGHDNKQQP